jgi:hypothetical protein
MYTVYQTSKNNKGQKYDMDFGQMGAGLICCVFDPINGE